MLHTVLFMVSKKLVGLGTVSLACALALLWFGSFSRSAPSAASAREIEISFVTCGRGDMSVRNLLSPAAQACILEVMLSAADAGHLALMQEALVSQISKTPGLYNACHNAGHQAGQRAFKNSGDIAALIRANTTATCNYAVGHGVLDGFAFSNPTDQQFLLAAQACDYMRDRGNQPVFGLCTDGLGHAAWTSTENVTDAAARCDLLIYADGRSACGSGIIMQMYEPAGTTPTHDLAAAVHEIPVLCTNWVGDYDTKLGCYSGAGYLYTRPAWVLNYSRTDADAEKLTPAESRQMLVIFTFAATKCRAHPEGYGVSTCLQSISQQVPPVIYSNPPLFASICALLGEWAEMCKTFRITAD